MSDYLKSDSASLDAREALSSSTAILLGVSDSAANALKLVEIGTVFDLAASSLFASANRILLSGRDPNDVYVKFGLAPKDLIHNGNNNSAVNNLQFASIDQLSALDPLTATALSEGLNVKTIRDLALWPPYLAARNILASEFFPEKVAGYDLEAPQELLPKSGEYATERVSYQTLVLDQISSQPDKDLLEAPPIDISPVLDASFGFKSLGVGALLTISQSWYPIGVALGQLLHSLALAPGESTRLAVMDWTRRTRSSVQESISETEELTNETAHDRVSSEVTNATAREAQLGFSSTANASTATQKGSSTGSATINVDLRNTLSLGLFGDDPGVSTAGTTSSESTSTTSGMTFTVSYGQRSLAASATQKVMDRTQQHANSARNRRAASIKEVSQQEHQSVSTRVVTNYNHMHALTVQYYEVVQVYKVEVKVSEVEKCLFIPMMLVDFDQRVVDRYRLVLARAALDRDAYRSLTIGYGVVEVIPGTPKVTIDKILFRIAAASAANAQFLNTALTPPTGEQPTPPKKVLRAPTNLELLAAKGYDLEQIDSASKILRVPIVRAGSDNLFLPDDAELTGVYVVEGSVGKKEVKIRGEATRVVTGIDSVSLTRAVPLSQCESVFVQSDKGEEQTVQLVLRLSHFGVTFPMTVSVRLSQTTNPQEVVRFGAVRASNDLLQHLNENKLHYSQAIYRSLDSSTLALLLSPYHYNGKPLGQLINPTPVAVSANYLVFKIHDEEFEFDEEGALVTDPEGEPVLSDWGKWLRSHGISKAQPKVELVPLPSGGVFAEAVLGRFNSAERVDNERFWNWQDSPIPLTATEIAPVELSTRATADDNKPGQLSAPIVSIVNPTQLPEPTAMASALQAIQNGNMFRDMSGLAATMGLAQAGISAASQGATAAGAQAGQNAAAAADLLGTLAKIAATVVTLGMGGAVGAAGGIAGGLPGSAGSGGSITGTAALINQGKKLTVDSSGGGQTPPLNGRPSSGQGVSGSGSDLPVGYSNVMGGDGYRANSSESLDVQAYKRAVWGPAGESQSDVAAKLLNAVSTSPSTQAASTNETWIWSGSDAKVRSVIDREVRRLEMAGTKDIGVATVSMVMQGPSRFLGTELGVLSSAYRPAFINAADFVFSLGASQVGKWTDFQVRSRDIVIARQRYPASSGRPGEFTWNVAFVRNEMLVDDPNVQGASPQGNPSEVAFFDSPGIMYDGTSRTFRVSEGLYSAESADRFLAQQNFISWLEARPVDGGHQRRISPIFRWHSRQSLAFSHEDNKWVAYPSLTGPGEGNPDFPFVSHIGPGLDV